MSPAIRRILLTPMPRPFFARGILYIAFTLAIASLLLEWTEGRKRGFQDLAWAHAKGHRLSTRADRRIRNPWSSLGSDRWPGFAVEAEREGILRDWYAAAARNPSWWPLGPGPELPPSLGPHKSRGAWSSNFVPASKTVIPAPVDKSLARTPTPDAGPPIR